MKNNKILLWGNVVFAFLTIITTIIFMQVPANPYITKTIASLTFVLCGIFNLVMLYTLKPSKENWKAILLILGLSFACAGDIVLIDFFIFGAILFAVGHLFFLSFFISLQKFTWIDAVCIGGLMLIAILLITLYSGFNFEGMMALIIAYAVIISLMLGKAVGNYIVNKSTSNLVALIGAGLFFFSDLMLLFHIFAGGKEIFDYFCVYTYYPAEFLLAFSVFFEWKEIQNAIKQKSAETQQIN